MASCDLWNEAASTGTQEVARLGPGLGAAYAQFFIDCAALSA
jgi:hypothetical protein